MKGRELVEPLQPFVDVEVICAADAEGNRFSPLKDGDRGVYSPEDAWAGRVLNQDELEEETTEEERARRSLVSFCGQRGKVRYGIR